jgi:hypothetical protein
MAAATSVVVERGTKQFQGMFSEMWKATGTLNADSLSDGAGSSDTITVPGVALGDIVVGFSFGVDLAGVTATAYVSAANTVTVRIQNESAGTVDLASTTVRVVVGRLG